MSTVWKGSAFECPSSNNEVILLHSRYSSSNSSASCNYNGSVTIVVQIVGVSGNTYTSQVTIRDSAIKSDLIGKTVECVRDNGSAAEVVMSYFITELLNFVNDTSKHNVHFVSLVCSLCNF